MNRSDFPRLVFADAKGEVFEHPALEAAGMKAGRLERLDPAHLFPLPEASELFLLPGRLAAGFDAEGRQTVLEFDPYSEKGAPCFAVAAFIPPGWTLTHSAAFRETEGAPMLPLFAYGACAWYKGKLHASAVRVDRGFRHDERFLDPSEIARGIKRFHGLFPKNRLVGHLEGCATVNGCANAKNFFLGRFEAPVPTSPVCNAQCQGCISFQPAGRMPPTQKRITFTPSPEEIAELALFHVERVPDPIVSFGQGCEGEPLLSAAVIEKSIRLIRAKTSHGTINLNSNASRPEALERLFEAGLDQIRVSANSVREPYYSRYYQPKGYSFREVDESVRTAKKHGRFVSINYLSMPGFTDSRAEFEAFREFVGSRGVDMVQWRNLNYDPLLYFRDLGLQGADPEALGMDRVIARLEREFPRLAMGYFNPSKRHPKRAPRAVR
ncbi:MAG TPA: radical SAM protein [Candidatus Eisenbacteria bacterium]|nr:radical SAM protein [Candidatus Eisenbacteria bacterium]